MVLSFIKVLRDYIKKTSSVKPMVCLWCVFSPGLLDGLERVGSLFHRGVQRRGRPGPTEYVCERPGPPTAVGASMPRAPL